MIFSIEIDCSALLPGGGDFNFSTIVQDHNFFWEDKESTVGKAHGTLSAAEEIEFIEVNFK